MCMFNAGVAYTRTVTIEMLSMKDYVSCLVEELDSSYFVIIDINS